MSDSGQETEAKFYVRDLGRIRKSLESLDAQVVQPRILEMNLRFDLPEASLRAQGRVLRLRRDTEARLTYKGGNKNTRGVLSREEIEFVVEDFEKAKKFLEALGYQQIFYYEKYRTTYELDKNLIMLDELPYGTFVEIEGNAEETIRALSEKLDLDWETAIERSYSALFEDVHKSLKLSFRDLSFENFVGIRVDATQLGVRVAHE
jgi:adenylyl cyclase CyaB, putative